MEDEILYDHSGNVEMVERESKIDPATDFERRVIAVQRKLKAPKSQENSFGHYKYRSCEDILEALKPLLAENDLLMTIEDDIVVLGERYYVRARVTVKDPISGLHLSTQAYAREPQDKKGSDQSQVTGSCSSYARKYALSALWLIDDTQDADATQGQQQAQQPAQQQGFNAHCQNCGQAYHFNSQDQYSQFIASMPRCCQSPHWVIG